MKKNSIKKGLVFVIMLVLLAAMVIVNIPTNVSAETPIKDNNLKLYCSFDDYSWSSGSYDVKDDSGNSNHGTKYGNAKYVSATKFGRAMEFDGTDDYVNFGDINAFDTPNLLTVELWFFRMNDYSGVNYDTNHGVNNVLIAQSSNAANDNLEIGTEGEYVEVYLDTTDYDGMQRWDCDILNNNWYYLALTFDGSNDKTKLYINGVLEKEWTNWGGNLDSSSTSPLTLGIARPGNEKWGDFNGIIDEVKVFTKVVQPSDGLGMCILKLGFDEGAGTIVYDRSGMNQEGTISGASWDSNGVFGSRCLSFSGGSQFYDGDCVTVAHSSYVDLTGPFTIEAWIKAQGSQSYYAIVDKYQYSSGTSYGYTLYLSGGGRLRLSVYSGANGAEDAAGTSDLRDNSWHHVVGTYDGSDIRVYVDGTQEGIDDWSYDPASTPGNYNLGIGKRLSGWGGYLPFYGKIDDVRIYNCVKKIGAEMLIMPFNEGSGSTTDDMSVWDTDGTISGASWTTDGKFGNALSFSGGSQFYDGDCVTVSHSSNIDLTGPFTIEAWIKAQGSQSYYAIVDKYQYSSGTSYGYTLYLSGPGKLRLSVYSGANGAEEAVGTSDLRDNSWHHVAGTYDGSDIRVYVDGIQEGIDDWSYNPASTPGNYNLGIGKRLSGWGGYLPFYGKIDNVIISNYPKTLHEDIDGDAMPDMYEILRSRDDDAEQYNSIEYNKRIAIITVGTYYNQQQYTWYLTSSSNFYYVLKSFGYSDIDIFYNVHINGPYTEPSNFDSNLVDDSTPSETELQNLLASFRSGGSRPLSNRDFLLFLWIDHGSVDSVPFKNGDTMTSTELTNYYNNIPFRRSALIFQQCYSGSFLDNIYAANRVACSSCRSDETEGGWIEKVIEGFHHGSTSDQNSDCVISLYEAWYLAARHVYTQETKHSQVEDNNDGTPHHYLDSGFSTTDSSKDGYLIARTYL